MKKWTLYRSEVLLAALAMTLGGCDGEWGERRTPLETRTFALHHIEASEAADLIGPYIYTERVGAPGMVSEVQDDSPAITVRETADNLERIAAVLAEFDRPEERTLALKFQLISPNGSESDPRIADVVDELGRFLRFDGYSLAGETFVSLGGGSFEQGIRAGEVTYQISGAYFPTIKRLDIELEENKKMGRVTRIRTSVVIQPGKTLVLGTVIGDNSTAILVVRSLVEEKVGGDSGQA